MTAAIPPQPQTRTTDAVMRQVVRQLTRVLGRERVLATPEELIAYEFDGTRYDCGCKLGYLKATMAFAAKHPEVGKEFSAYLSSLGCRLPKPGRV